MTDYKIESEHTGDLECCKVTQVFAIDTSATKDIDHIIYDSSSMTFPWRGDMTYTLQLSPFPTLEIEGPNIIIMILSVCTTKSSPTVRLLKSE